MVTRSDTKQTVESLSAQWHQGHAELGEFFDECRQWAYEVAQTGFPHFGELAERLKQLRERLADHFTREDEISDQLVALHGAPSPEADANRRRAQADHEHLLVRLDGLISKLGELEPPFDSWQQAIGEVELFCDALDQHEEQESDCIAWLLPKKG
jgi:iron-sulfur cluster repair protein YtfE (RIC family)